MIDGKEPALYVDIAEMIDNHKYEQAMAEAALQQTVQLTRIADAAEAMSEHLGNFFMNGVPVEIVGGR